MRIDAVIPNNRRKAFEIRAGSRRWVMPYSRLHLVPTPSNRVDRAFADSEAGREAFTYVLENGEEDTVHLDAVLEYNADPEYLAELLLYRLTIDAQRALAESDLATREVIRRLGTSASQFYRLMDATNSRKSIGQMLSLLHVLDRDVDLVIKSKVKPRTSLAKRSKTPRRNSA